MSVIKLLVGTTKTTKIVENSSGGTTSWWECLDPGGEIRLSDRVAMQVFARALGELSMEDAAHLAFDAADSFLKERIRRHLLTRQGEEGGD